MNHEWIQICRWQQQKIGSIKYSDKPNNIYLWNPSLVLAKVVVEELCKAKHLFPCLQYIFIYPSLMTWYWREILRKVADLLFTFKSYSYVWNSNTYELLTIAFIKPLLNRPPLKLVYHQVWQNGIEICLMWKFCCQENQG